MRDRRGLVPLRRSPSGPRWRWWSVAASALVLGVVALLATVPRGDPRVVVLSPASTAAPTTSLVAKTSTRVTRVPLSRPKTLSIPAIGVTTKVGRLGLQADGEVMVPTNTHSVGWYVDGQAPGQMGSAVILGHVDSYRGPGTFFNLKLLTSGDNIDVTLDDGVVTHFVVSRVVQYSKRSFPDGLVYGSHGTRSLQLVTCGGTFDHTTGHYESNIVVFSNLVSVSIPKLA